MGGNGVKEATGFPIKMSCLTTLQTKGRQMGMPAVVGREGCRPPPSTGYALGWPRSLCSCLLPSVCRGSKPVLYQGMLIDRIYCNLTNF